MDWILYAAGVVVIAIGIITIVLSVAFVLYMEYPVRYEEKQTAAELTFKGKTSGLLLYHEKEYYVHDTKLSEVNIGDQVGVTVHSTYNRRGGRITRRLTLNDPDL